MEWQFSLMEIGSIIAKARDDIIHSVCPYFSVPITLKEKKMNRWNCIC